MIGKCPSVGCNLHAELHQGAYIPAVDPGCRRDLMDQQIESYGGIQRILKDRRDGLALSIREAEDITGIATDYIAKIVNRPAKLTHLGGL